MSGRDFLPWLGARPANAPDHARDVEPGVEPALTIHTPRREFMKLLGLGGLVIAAGPFGARRLEAADRLFGAAAEPWEPHAYVRVAEDGIVTIICHRSEMGQGIRTTMPMIIADEMEADWSKCRVEQAVGDEPKYGSQNTDGSTSIRDFLSKYREAGATVRALMEDAAAKEWGVAAGEVAARNGEVVHSASGRTKGFGALVATARTIAMPAAARIRIKAPGERRWEGKQMPSIDLVPMTTGTAMYGADVTVPGMKVAVIARPPVWQGRSSGWTTAPRSRCPGWSVWCGYPRPRRRAPSSR